LKRTKEHCDSTLTLNGAANTAFVLNISGNFNISGGSRVLLTGGLTPSDVLFNVTGNPSGAKFQITGGSLFNGPCWRTMTPRVGRGRFRLTGKTPRPMVS
jgi:hypothetical protein